MDYYKGRCVSHVLRHQPLIWHWRSLPFRLSVLSCARFVEVLCRSARLSQATRRGEASDASGRQHVSARLVFRPVEEAWGFVRTPAGLVWPDASDKLAVYQEPGTW